MYGSINCRPANYAAAHVAQCRHGGHPQTVRTMIRHHGLHEARCSEDVNMLSSLGPCSCIAQVGAELSWQVCVGHGQNTFIDRSILLLLKQKPRHRPFSTKKNGARAQNTAVDNMCLAIAWSMCRHHDTSSRHARHGTATRRLHAATDDAKLNCRAGSYNACE